jgi:WXG100 protein secretion system (Wss), protein YukD
MAVLLVTVAGPDGRRDLVVPAEVPVGDLAAPIAAALAEPHRAAPARDGTEPAGWRLGTTDGDLLPAERSLAACGIGDGATLVLSVDPQQDAGSSPPSLAGSPQRLRRCAVVGVVSAAAGAGRTTVAALLASVLAATREGMTVAVDAHPGPGSLTELSPHHHAAAGDLLALLEHPALTTGELVAVLAPRGRRPALVAAAAAARGPTAPPAGGGQGDAPAPFAGGGHGHAPAPFAGGGHAPAPLDRRALTRLVHGLAAHAGALVLDCGPGLDDPGARVALATADQLVLVAEPEPSLDSRRVAGALADLGHAVVAVTASPSRAGAGPPRPGGSGWRVGGGTFGPWLGGPFGRWLGRGAGSWGAGPAARLLPGVRGVVALPPRPGGVVAADPPPAAGGWDEVPPWWRRPARQLADLLAADWPALGIATADPKPAGQAAQTGCRSRS